MQKQHYTASIDVARTPEEVFDCVNDVSRWWSRDYEGNSARLNDEFVIHHPGRHYSRQRLVEVVPNRRVVWLVTDSTLDWIESDRSEWTSTRMVFEISARGDRTALQFTHEGLVPERECHAKCEQGWNVVIKDWLFNFITTGKSI
jgi:hypothetical protein